MRRLLPLLPVVAVAASAGLLVAHDATWSIVLGVLVAVVAIGLGVSAAQGRLGAVLALVAVAAIWLGTAAAASGLWLSAFGTEATATVSHVQQYYAGKGIGRADAYTLRLADGSEVAGTLRPYRLGSYREGDRVDVTYDPTGLVRFPVAAGDRHHAHDAVGGPVAVAAGLALLVFARLRRPSPPEPGGPHLANVRVSDLRRRLDAEHPEGSGAGAA